MAKQLKPANIRIHSPTPQNLKSIRRVYSLNTYEGATESFDPNGMYSVETFGRVGEKARMITFGYIDAKLEVLHPHVFRELVNLKDLYGGILNGNQYATWDPKIKDFVPASPSEGHTGYAFFMSHWDDIKFPKTGALGRENVIKMMDNNRKNSKIRYILVLPAGLRELEIKDGRPSEDVINGMYRRVIAISQTVNEQVKSSDPVNNTARYQLQIAFNDIYNELFGRIEGKNGFIQSKFMARGVHNATANVITAMDCSSGDLFGPTCPDPRSFVMGLFQFSHAVFPRLCYELRTKFLAETVWGRTTAKLIWAKNLKPFELPLKEQSIDLYGTYEGLQRVANRFENIKFRRQPAAIQGAYLKLIYDHDGEFYLLDSIDNVRDEAHKEHVRPMTWGEVFYYALYDIAKEAPVESTRYPVAGEGSAVMTYTYLKTTQPSVIKYELLESGEQKLYNEWPTDTMAWLESSQPHPGRHAGYAADHDGDMLTSLVSIAQEVIIENRNYYNSWASVYGSNGELNVTIDMDITEWVLAGATQKNVGV